MSDLNKFKSKVSADKKLQKKIDEASTIKDVVEIAASIGCNVSDYELKEDMMNAISGGFDFDKAGMGVNTIVETGDNTVKFYENINKEIKFKQEASGAGSFTTNNGNFVIS